MNSKKWYLSKTLWANALAGVALVVQNATGNNLVSPELQSALIVLANFVLRLVTKDAVIS